MNIGEAASNAHDAAILISQITRELHALRADSKTINDNAPEREAVERLIALAEQAQRCSNLAAAQVAQTGCAVREMY